MSSSKTFFHIFLIGAASNSQSEGQLPDVNSLVTFQENNPDKIVYYYFIDPGHRNNERDRQLIYSYMESGIPCTIVYSPFAYKTFNKEYKVLPGDEALFIDCAGVSASEHDFIQAFGKNRQNWWYLTLGCSSGKLEISQAHKASRDVPKYTVLDDCKVPLNLSYAYREQLLGEINKYVLYVRLLPSKGTDPDPPEWMRERHDIIREGYRSTWKILRESAEHILHNFFAVNEVEIYAYPTTEWYAAAKKLLNG